MVDQSYLDKKYFIDNKVYNCPLCNRNNVSYSLLFYEIFNWTASKKCYAHFVLCNSCAKTSMHLSFEEIADVLQTPNGRPEFVFKPSIDLDSKIFYSVPTSFFTIDDRIPREIRELISEAEGCLKMNYLTGSSACMRKAIYELLVLEGTDADHYEDKIKQLKDKFPNSDPELFDIMGHIQQMTSDKIHEQSWDKWDSTNLHLIIETLKTVLYDIYVLPKMKEERSKTIKGLRESALTKRK